MLSTGFLTGALALLCLIAVIISISKRKLSKDGKAKSADLKGVFFAIGFVPMVIMTISSFRAQSPVIFNFFAYIRNPFLSVEFTLDAFAGLGEFSFVIDFFTAILFGSTVALTLSNDFESLCVSDHIPGGAGHRNEVFEVRDPEHKEVTASYLRYCRILS